MCKNKELEPAFFNIMILVTTTENIHMMLKWQTALSLALENYYLSYFICFYFTITKPLNSDS